MPESPSYPKEGVVRDVLRHVLVSRQECRECGRSTHVLLERREVGGGDGHGLPESPRLAYGHRFASLTNLLIDARAEAFASVMSEPFHRTPI